MKRPSHSPCPVRRLPSRKLDDAIAAVLVDLSRDPRLFLAAAERGDAAASSELGSAEALRDRRRSELASLDARLRHLIGIFGEGGPVPEALKDECVMLDGQRRDRLLDLERLDRRIDDLRSRAVDPGAIGASLRSFAECHQTLDRAGLKTALGSLVTRVVVQRGKHENRPNAREGGGSSEGQIQTRCIKVNIGVATSPGGSKVLTNLRLVSISGNAGSPIGATVRTPPRCSPSPCSGPRPPEQKSICAFVPQRNPPYE